MRKGPNEIGQSDTRGVDFRDTILDEKCEAKLNAMDIFY